MVEKENSKEFKQNKITTFPEIKNLKHKCLPNSSQKFNSYLTENTGSPLDKLCNDVQVNNCSLLLDQYKFIYTLCGENVDFKKCLKRGTFLKFYIPLYFRLSAKLVRIVSNEIQRKYLGTADI